MPNDGLLKECKVIAGTIIKGNFNISPSLDVIGLISQKWLCEPKTTFILF